MGKRRLAFIDVSEVGVRMSERIGLIAGAGELPCVLAERAAERGKEVVVIKTLAGAPVRPLPGARVHDVFFGEWDRIVRTLKSEGVTRVYLAGKISREHLYSTSGFDARFMAIVSAAGSRNDDAMMLRFVEDLEREGIEVGSQLDYLDHLCFEPGVLTSRRPSPSEWEDIARGFEVAKGIAALDVGQTAVVKQGGVLAVEAIEGTDRTIQRGLELGRGGAVIVKVAKPKQDLRFDVPTVGQNTLEAISRAGGGTLAFEARITLAVEGKRFVDAAEQLGITVVSYEPGLEGAYS